MDTEEARVWANSVLAKYIGQDFSLDSVQIEFCHQVHIALLYFRKEGLVATTLGRPVIGVTFDHDGGDFPMLIIQ